MYRFPVVPVRRHYNDNSNYSTGTIRHTHRNNLQSTISDTCCGRGALLCFQELWFRAGSPALCRQLTRCNRHNSETPTAKSLQRSNPNPETWYHRGAHFLLLSRVEVSSRVTGTLPANWSYKNLFYTFILACGGLTDHLLGLGLGYNGDLLLLA